MSFDGPAFLSSLAGLQGLAAPPALTLQSASQGWLKGLSIEQPLDILAGRGPAHGSGTVCDTCGRLVLEVRLSYCALPRQRMLGRCLVGAQGGVKSACRAS